MLSLKDLCGEMVQYTFGGVKYDCLLFDCPLSGCEHSCLVPFSDDGKNMVSGQKVWKRISGKTIEDITLSPSYRLLAPCSLHGFVRSGHWIGC